jgi:hypothetical protein
MIEKYIKEPARFPYDPNFIDQLPYRVPQRNNRLFLPAIKSRSYRDNEVFQRSLKVLDSDLVFIYKDVTLPEGCSIEEVRDALMQAKAVEAQEFGIVVFVKPDLGDDYTGGFSLYPRNYVNLSVSVLQRLAKPLNIPGFAACPVNEQMWAVAFEEALHLARKANGKDLTPPIRIKAKSLADITVEEAKAYANQERERAIDDVLNSGILQRKFGRDRLYINKRVIRELPFEEVHRQLMELRKESSRDLQEKNYFTEILDRRLDNYQFDIPLK